MIIRQGKEKKIACSFTLENDFHMKAVLQLCSAGTGLFGYGRTQRPPFSDQELETVGNDHRKKNGLTLRVPESLLLIKKKKLVF